MTAHARRLERLAHLEEEPSIADPHVTVSIRHRILNSRKTRLFPEDSTFTKVYNWAGSLSAEPEHFGLKDYNGNLVLPSTRLYSCVLNMYTMNAEELPDELVAFYSNSVTNNNDEADNEEDVENDQANDATTNNDDEVDNEEMVTEEIDMPEESVAGVRGRRTRRPPVRNHDYVGEDGEVGESMDDINRDILLLGVEEKRRKCQPMASSSDTVTVRRDLISEDISYLLGPLEKLSTFYKFQFQDEDAVGDGVSRDAISEFYESAMSAFDGDVEKVPNIDAEPEEMEAMGKALSMGFVLYGVFSPSICHATLKCHLFGKCSDEELYKSFMNFLPDKLFIPSAFSTTLR